MSRMEHLELIKGVYLAAPIMREVIALRRKAALTTLLQEHRSGSTNHIGKVAELTALCDLENDITSKANEYETIMEVQNAKSRTK